MTFHLPTGDAYALRGVDLTVGQGEIVGLVGETGCGKSVTGRAIMRLIDPPGEITGGSIRFDNRDVRQMDQAALRSLRGREISMIFQNPGAALNPLFSIGQQITAVLRQHGVARGKALQQRTLQLLADVGLPEPERIAKLYPHQLSGGMQQRAMIAIALSSEPRLLIADEPTTALDVTIQSQILDLLLKLRATHGISIILITHDLGIVAETCDRVVVLYAGTVAETGSIRQLFQAPAHPYTQALLRALPYGQTRKQPLRVIGGTVPNGRHPLPGCAFAPRCPFVMDVCGQQPPLFQLSEHHQAACFLHQEAGAS